MTRVTLFMAIATVAIAVYLGLAVHVVTRSPRRLISWVFSAFCLTIASYYLTSLFLFPRAEPPLFITPLPLRWKWAALCFSPTFYLHLVSFYFPPAWRRVRLWILPFAYLASIVFALGALFTDLLVAGPLYRPLPYIIGPLPGPMMGLFATFFSVEVIGGTFGLIISYRLARSPSLRRQILYLLVPTGLVILSGVLNWIIVLTEDADRIPHELGDIFFILGAFFYANAVLRYGSFVGRPTARRDLFYSALAASLGLSAIYLTLTLDRWLVSYTPFPYPLTTGMLVVIIAVGFPVIRRQATMWLDGLFFGAERRQQTASRYLLETLAETPDPKDLQAELLGALCAALGVRGGYIALPHPDSAPGTLTVQIVQGNLSVRPGDQVRRPPPRGRGPLLVAALLPQQPLEPGWQEVALFCSLTTGLGSDGVLALAEKRDGKPFAQGDLTLCTDLAGRLDTLGRMVHLRKQRNRYLETARRHDQALRRLEEEVAASARQTLNAWEGHASPPADTPLEIRLLGRLKVMRKGEPLPEGAWETEKAKALLAYLLWKGPTGATREEISTALWPDRLVEETANVFHVTLHRLRRALEPEPGKIREKGYILYQLGRYRFNPDAPHWLDATAFRELIAAGDPDSLREAVALYRGALLEDMDWALPPEVETDRRALEELYVFSLRRLAARVEGNEVQIYLERLLAIEPADETAHCALVTGYLARGRRYLARRQVARWQATLAELDLEPSPEAMELWRMVEGRDRGTQSLKNN
jgi:DNA-binding SARP family transcriptional activator